MQTNYDQYNRKKCVLIYRWIIKLNKLCMAGYFVLEGNSKLSIEELCNSYNIESSYVWFAYTSCEIMQRPYTRSKQNASINESFGWEFKITGCILLNAFKATT